MDLIWGLVAAATDRWIGQLDGVVVDAESRQVTHLVIKRGFLFVARRHSIPVDHITRCDHEGVYLNIPMSDAYAASESATYDDNAASVSLSSKTRVETLDASLRIKGLRFESVGYSITHLILYESGGDEFVAPIDRVAELSADGISLEVRDTDIGNFPLYRQDHDIEADVWEALYASEEISDVDLKWVKIEVIDGAVTMTGNVRDPSAKREAEVVAALVAGVASVVNRIVSDWDIELQIANLIAKKTPRLSDDISIHTQLGTVTLYGHVTSEEQKGEMVAAIPSVAGVRSVKDNLQIRVPVPVAVESPEEKQDDDAAEGTTESDSEETDEEETGVSA